MYPVRKRTHLKNYDYSSPGCYYVTLCTRNRKQLLSHVQPGSLPGEVQIVLTPHGMVAERELKALENRYPDVRIDGYVIMPNHIHALITLTHQAAGASPRPTLMQVIGGFKSLTTRKCAIGPFFQPSFYEHVIRNEQDYEEKAQYIRNNPVKWSLDELFVQDEHP